LIEGKENENKKLIIVFSSIVSILLTGCGDTDISSESKTELKSNTAQTTSVKNTVKTTTDKKDESVLDNSNIDYK